MDSCFHDAPRRLFSRFPLASCLSALACFLAVAPLAATTRAAEPPGKPAAAAKSPPEASPDALTAQIAELIEQLGDAKYVVRERAQSELQRIGPPALDGLAKARESNDVEVSMRAQYLLGSIKVAWTEEKDPAGIRELLKNYDELEEAGRQARIEELARIGGETEIEILCRMVRYERSHLLSKRAALLIIGLPVPAGAKSWQDRAAIISTGVGGTRRAGAEWLRAYVRHHDKPQEALADWKRLIESEQQSLKASPGFTSRDIVSELLRREVEMLEPLGRRDEAVEAMRQLVPLESGQPQSLIRLVEWLTEKKAWSVIDDVAARFGPAFDQQPRLMYTLAEARSAQGNEALARQIAARAMALIGDDLSEHVSVAGELRRQGLFRWAEQEYRHAMTDGPLENGAVIDAHHGLAEMLHDQGQDEAAGKALQHIVSRMDSQPAIAQTIRSANADPGSIRSRMHYCFSEQERLKGNIARQTELLDLAAASDPTDADVLVALYRLPNQTGVRRQQTLQKIKAAADSFRKEVLASPENPEPYNKLAWLLGNTLAETDKTVADEAIRASKRSLELLPGEGGLLDTLARCYYARGDYEAAVHYQTEAARLEPHSGLIRKQLDLFQKSLDDSSRKGVSQKLKVLKKAIDAYDKKVKP